ncbi:MAG: HAD family hydrolase [Oscillospiraceae bacterium]|jgi:phosphoglycolate phosphatase|nr:HAD family hydrolase [Oscillospiraceae bacterium]
MAVCNAPLVVFDLDGTLSVSLECILESVRRTLDASALPRVSDDFVKSLIGEQYSVFFRHIAPDCTDYAKLERLYTDVEYDVFREQGRLYPGVPQLLRELRELGCAVALLSNGSVEYEELVTNALGIRDCFDALESGSAYHGKGHALRDLMARYPRMHTVMVGDRRHDIEAALECGAIAVAALYGYGDDSEFGGAHFKVNAPLEVAAVVREC